MMSSTYEQYIAALKRELPEAEQLRDQWLQETREKIKQLNTSTIRVKERVVVSDKKTMRALKKQLVQDAKTAKRLWQEINNVKRNLR